MKKIVLVIEQDLKWKKIFSHSLNEKGIEFLQADTLEEAEKFYSANSEKISIVVMGSCAGNKLQQSVDLIKKIRLTFNGPIIASARSTMYMDELTDAGCDFKCYKLTGFFIDVLENALKKLGD